MLRAFNLSLLYHGAHLEQRTAYMRRKKGRTDCTHFCEPSSLFLRLSAELVAAVDGDGTAR